MNVDRYSGKGIGRRELLRRSAAALALAPVSGWPRPIRATRVLTVYLGGGISHLDTFDPKLAAPSQHRGPYGTIPTRTPGVRFADPMARLARCSGLFALCRSQVTGTDQHETAAQWMLTGRYGDMRGGDHPAIGSLIARVLGPIGSAAGNVAVPRAHAFTWELGGPAWLGREYDSVGAAPDDLGPAADSDLDRYGRGALGRQALAARRLLERGARFVLLNQGGWDAHADLARHYDMALPALDRSIAALLQDLHASGLLDETLVVMAGDFGRAPRINSHGGRDHWAHAASMLIAGAGVRGGQVIGATDAAGAGVTERPIRPAEIAATIYHALGIEPRSLVRGPDGGQRVLLPQGDPIHELWG